MVGSELARHVDLLRGGFDGQGSRKRDDESGNAHIECRPGGYIAAEERLSIFKLNRMDGVATGRIDSCILGETSRGEQALQP